MPTAQKGNKSSVMEMLAAIFTTGIVVAGGLPRMVEDQTGQKWLRRAVTV